MRAQTGVFPNICRGNSLFTILRLQIAMWDDKASKLVFANLRSRMRLYQKDDSFVLNILMLISLSAFVHLLPFSLNLLS